MGYPRKLLNPDEQIVLDLNPHWRIFFAPAALLLLALVGVVVVVQVLDVDPTIEVASAIPALLAAIWFTWRFIVWRSTHFVLTSDRVIYRSGVVSKTSQNIPLERINNVAFTQSVIERLLRSGDLIIESAGESGRQTFADVLTPSKVENRIYAEMEAAKARDDRRAGSASISPAQELARFAELRADGVISEAEFQAQKTRLLGS